MWAGKIWEGTEAPEGVFTISLDSGEIEAGKLHEDLEGEGGRFLGKCTGLEPACKQCHIAAKRAHSAVFAAKNPATGKAEFFDACAPTPSGGRRGSTWVRP